MTDAQIREKLTWDFIAEVSTWPNASKAAVAVLLLSAVAEQVGMAERDFFAFVMNEAEMAASNPDVVH